VRKVKDTIKDSIFAELTGVIDDWGLGKYFTVTTSPMRIINNLTQSDCIFRGLDDVEKIKSVK
jgi:phage terminase large subunit